MIKVVIVGVAGKMGRIVAEMVNEAEDLELIGGVENANHPIIGSTVGKGLVTNNLEDIITKADVVVEFAIPEITIQNAQICARAQKPFIIGTTGHSNYEELIQYCKDIPMLIAPNFSLGVNLLYQLTYKAADVLKDFDINLIETHHKLKRDAPSGTAKKLAGIIKEQTQKEINVVSLRAGDIVGEHTLQFVGPGEVLELRHFALSRRAFGNGVIKAIRFIVNQKPGLYQMSDVLAT
jgi:4-hydroxy-tetrahydrodipicolinate reductase